MVEAEGLIIPVVHLDHECGLHLTVLLCMRTVPEYMQGVLSFLLYA
jgi:hypothetical protein